jgi:hypothetical protein
MLRLTISLNDTAADQLAVLALKEGRNARRIAAELLGNALFAEERRRARGTDAKVSRLTRELVEAVEKMP